MSAAGVFADKAEGLGWTVTRKKMPGRRVVRAALNNETFTFEWTLNEKTGNMIFAEGKHCWDEVEPGEEWSNMAAALRIMAEPGFIHPTREGWVRLPFDPHTATDAEVLNRVQGRELTWHNTVTGATEAAIVPWGGKHTTLTVASEVDGPARRILTFASYEAGETPVAGYPHGKDTRAGFRSVRLSSLTGVGERVYKPREVAA